MKFIAEYKPSTSKDEVVISLLDNGSYSVAVSDSKGNAAFVDISPSDFALFVSKLVEEIPA